MSGLYLLLRGRAAEVQRYALRSMSSKDWFRNTDWNDEIEAGFFAKLRRARDKSQYLRIQACTLASSHPTIALNLLNQYFSLGDHFDLAQAYVDQAKAYLAVGDLENAIESYEAALIREHHFPNLQTQARLDLPFLIATQQIERLYDRALELLKMSRAALTFPVDSFRWHASHALIYGAQGRTADALLSACEALEWARKEHSGLRYHPTIGLVGGEFDSVQSKLNALCNA